MKRRARAVRARRKKRFFLGVVARFKDERHLLPEWLAHHARVGVQHFWLVDDGSTDGYQLGPFSSRVTIIRGKGGESQSESYTRVASSIRGRCVWIAVIDLDEFLYAHSPRSLSVVPVLRSLSSRVSSVRVLPRTFLPTGAFTDPKSKIGSLTYACTGKDVRAKGIHRLARVGAVGVHRARPRRGVVSDDPGPLRINHYRFPSYEAVFGNKEAKGCPAQKNAQATRDAAGRYRRASGLIADRCMGSKGPVRRCTYLKDRSRGLRHGHRPPMAYRGTTWSLRSDKEAVPPPGSPARYHRAAMALLS